MKCLILLLLSFLLASCCGMANAALVQFKMTGTVVVEHELILPPDVVTGASFIAFLSYDTSVLDQLPNDPNRGQYVVESSLGQIKLVMHVGSMEIRNAEGSTALIQVFDNAGLIPGVSPPMDSLGFSMNQVGAPPDPFFSAIGFSLFDLEFSAWDSDALPTTLDVSQFEGAQVSVIGGARREGYYSIVGQVSGAIRVPETVSLQGIVYGCFYILSLTRTVRRRQ